jgi:hypothetical protein
MNLKLLIISLVASLVIFSGCVGDSGVEDIAMGLPQVQAFMEQYPDAQFKAMLLEQDVVAENLADIKAECGIGMKADADYWKVELSQGNVEMTIYIRKSDNEAMCMYMNGADGVPGEANINDPVEHINDEGETVPPVEDPQDDVTDNDDIHNDETNNNTDDDETDDEADMEDGAFDIEIIQLTNYDQVIHRAPEHASISGDGSKFAFFRFIDYYNELTEKDHIRPAVYVGNTSSLNQPKKVFESGTIVGRTREHSDPLKTKSYYWANVSGSTALTDDGKYAYFISTDTFWSEGFGRVSLAKVNTETSELTPMFFPALSGYEETNITNFHIVGNKIYYSVQLVKEGLDRRDWLDTAIFSMDLDGSNKTMLAKTLSVEYPNIYESSMKVDVATGKLYFEGQETPHIDAIYTIENGAFKKIGMSEEDGESGLFGVHNNNIVLRGSGPDLLYNASTGDRTEIEVDLYPTAFVANNGDVIYGKVGFSKYNPVNNSTKLIIGHKETENSEYRDHYFKLVNTIIPYMGEVISSDGKTILMQEEKTGFGNYYVIKLSGGSNYTPSVSPETVSTTKDKYELTESNTTVVLSDEYHQSPAANPENWLTGEWLGTSETYGTLINPNIPELANAGNGSFNFRIKDFWNKGIWAEGDPNAKCDISKKFNIVKLTHPWDTGITYESIEEFQNSGTVVASFTIQPDVELKSWISVDVPVAELVGEYGFAIVQDDEALCRLGFYGHKSSSQPYFSLE